jgi:hypothetical protein
MKPPEVPGKQQFDKTARGKFNAGFLDASLHLYADNLQ